MKIKVCFSYPSPRSPQALFKGLLGPRFRALGGVSTADLGRLQTLSPCPHWGQSAQHPPHRALAGPQRPWALMLQILNLITSAKAFSPNQVIRSHVQVTRPLVGG